MGLRTWSCPSPGSGARPDPGRGPSPSPDPGSGSIPGSWSGLATGPVVLIFCSCCLSSTGHWKANRAKKFIGGVHDRQICLTDFTHKIVSMFLVPKHFETIYV